MKIAILIKQVPDTETKIVINADKTGIETNNVKFIMGPYDEIAVEEALKIGGETTVISMGSDRTVEALRTALAMGIQNAIHVETEGKIFDPFQTATALASIIKQNNFDLILCGKQAIDHDQGQVACMVAEILNIPQVMLVDKISISGNTARIERRGTGGTKEIYETSFPVVIGCERGLNTPRYPSLPGIMKAKSKPIQKILAKDLLGDTQNLICLKNLAPAPERSAGRILSGTVEEQVSELARLLKSI